MSSQTREKKPLDAFEVLQFAPLLPLLPLGGAFAHYLTHRKSWSAAAKVALGASAALTVANIVRWQLNRVHTPSPRYDVTEREGSFEIRRYRPMVIAKTTVLGDFEYALDEGFSRLAEYIFGKNSRADRLEMSGPVLSGEKLQMTSPVTTQSSGQGGFTVSFVMPPGRAVTDLPTPIDPRVELETIPAREIAVYRFTGRYDEASVFEGMSVISGYVSERGLKARGAPTFAGYDAPSTIPVLRRNEVWVELQSHAALNLEPLPVEPMVEELVTDPIAHAEPPQAADGSSSVAPKIS